MSQGQEEKPDWVKVDPPDPFARSKSTPRSPPRPCVNSALAEQIESDETLITRLDVNNNKETPKRTTKSILDRTVQTTLKRSWSTDELSLAIKYGKENNETDGDENTTAADKRELSPATKSPTS